MIKGKHIGILFAFAIVAFLMLELSMRRKMFDELLTDSDTTEPSNDLFAMSLNSTLFIEATYPQLAEYIRDKWLNKPSGTPYKPKPGSKPALGQIGQVRQMKEKNIFTEDQLKQKGFFLEVGAVDGVLDSNSLHFETQYGWTGILIEPQLKHYNELVANKRNAYTLHACLSTTAFAETFDFYQGGTLGGIVDKFGRYDEAKRDIRKQIIVKTQCFPLYAILLALGNPTVDFMSLDIEGAELAVIEATPWDKIDVRVLMVEVNKVNPEKVTLALQKYGYKKVLEMGKPLLDIVFKKTNKK